MSAFVVVAVIILTIFVAIPCFEWWRDLIETFFGFDDDDFDE